ncbi:MAG: aldo/keto reductase [Anaerolineae bacterium]|nr:aldo/keto reductase [Anaerolineae bacterium]MCA9887546.1 aldo/keto reductase [Anaerolineae bacterium]MCB9460798.1 aldo/keto reductase [Anaerolineaceae bacterium]
MALEKRTLGRTGLQVTQLGYGAMEVRGRRIWGGRPCTDEQAETILNAVLDAGINFIDTANDYGKSEMYLGQYLSSRRDEFYVATKCGCQMIFAGDHDETPHIFTRDNIRRNIADSLMKMRTDYVDILQLHNPDVATSEANGVVDTLNELREEGVVKHIGCSSTSPHLATYIDWGVFDVFQIPYSALERQHENLITKAAEAGAGIIIRGGVARGEPGEGLGNQDRWAAFEKANLDELLEAGESRTAFLLRFTLSHPHCDTTIVGTLNPEHLAENIAIAEKGPLPADVYAEAKKRLDAAGQSPE